MWVWDFVSFVQLMYADDAEINDHMTQASHLELELELRARTYNYFKSVFQTYLSMI